MFSNSIRHIQSISGYDQAARFFTETRKPKTSRWADDERPLYNTRSLHYKIVRGANADYFDLVNYDTPLVRYYRPEANGDQRILVRDWYSMVSRQFLYKHRWFNGKPLRVLDTEGVREGKLLLNHHVEKAEDFGIPQGWSADIIIIGSTHAENPLVDLTRSRHIPGYKAATSDEDKWARKKVKTLCDHWIELLGYRLDEYLNSEIDANKWRVRNAGQAFTSALEMLGYSEQDDIKSAVQAEMGGDEGAMDGETFINAMTKLGHAVATHLQGVRENQREVRRGYDEQGVWRTLFEGEVQPVTRADFRKSMESHLISLLNLRTGSARVDIGQFPESIPRRWWC